MSFRFFRTVLLVSLVLTVVSGGSKPVFAQDVQTDTSTESTTPEKQDTTPPPKDTTPPPKDTTPPPKETTPPSKETTPPSKETTPPSKETTPPSKETTPPAQVTTSPTKATSPQPKAAAVETTDSGGDSFQQVLAKLQAQLDAQNKQIEALKAQYASEVESRQKEIDKQGKQLSAQEKEIVTQKDPESGNLDRVQIIKGWYQNGYPQEKIYDVALSDGRSVDPKTGKAPAVGNTVDVKNASYTNTIGESTLSAVWTDPDFKPEHHAVYYVRVLEIPTPRWSTYDAKALGIAPPDGVEAAIQERAWSSPIWYTPDAKLVKKAIAYPDLHQIVN